MGSYHIRPLKEEDGDRMLEWMRDEDITRYLQIGGKETKKEDVLRFIRSSGENKENLNRAIADENDRYMGTVSLKHIDPEKKEAEYAISMHPSALGTGASAEGSRQIIRLGFEELGLERIYLNVLESNQRAVRFYTKFGFRFTGRSTLLFHGEEKELLWFEINRL